jgi:hypothetical protein
MPLSPGTRLGSYEIAAPLGAGGMDEVYGARDTILKRDVALKVLPAAFERDPERMARFQREAELLASLNHPNIAIIHGLVESDGQRALVMEFVPGETLDARLKRGAMPASEAPPIARQIAEALEAAHERGVVHRICGARTGGKLLTWMITRAGTTSGRFPCPLQEKGSARVRRRPCSLLVFPRPRSGI